MVIQFRTASTPDTLIATRNLSSVPTKDTYVTAGGKDYRVSSIQWILKDSGTTLAVVRLY